MVEWFNEFWTTKAGFERVFKGIMFIIGSLFTVGVIPTGIDNGGPIIGTILQGGSVAFPAGDKNKNP